MKTAEDFRRDFGEPEDSFRLCIRQTLTELECKEEQPVKKKINIGLVLVLTVMLLAVTAAADGQWGILSFLQDRGKTASDEQLLSLQSLPEPTLHTEYDLVDAAMTEALYEDGTLYLAVSLTPLKENTMVVPAPETNIERSHRYIGHLNSIDTTEIDLSATTMQDAMKDPAYGDVTVLDYAKAHGFDFVVLLKQYSINMTSTLAYWSQDQYDGLQEAEYTLTENGSLQIVLQTGYKPNMAFAESRMESAQMSMKLWEFDVQAGGEWLSNRGASAGAYFAIPADRPHLSSIAEDAHDIAGYIGAIDFISIAPYDDEYMAITIQLNMSDDATEDVWMTGPAWVIVDAEGNRLCTVDQTKYSGTVRDADGDRRHRIHGLFPASYMPEGNQITLQAENRQNWTIVYDAYTYTLVDQHTPIED